MQHPNWKDAECPDWYQLIQAARYLGVAPWDLARQSTLWQDWAWACQAAEAKAAEK